MQKLQTRGRQLIFNHPWSNPREWQVFIQENRNIFYTQYNLDIATISWRELAAYQVERQAQIDKRFRKRDPPPPRYVPPPPPPSYREPDYNRPPDRKDPRDPPPPSFY